jgi:hypothetical protein
MIKNTPEFKKELENNLSWITFSKNNPLILKGSYKTKPLGSFISDIDFTALVYFNDILVKKIVSIIENLPQSNKFTFIRLKSGFDKKFQTPWSIDKIGGCEYNQDDTDKWLKNLKEKVDDKTYQEISNILNKDEIQIRDLIEVENILKPYSEIIWKKEDIKRGYIIKNEVKYDLLETLKNNQAILKYLYKYPIDNKNYYVSIDVALVDKKFPFKSNILYNYYTGNWYKILKSFKYYIKKDYFDQYLKDLNSIDLFTSLLANVRMLSKIVKYKLINQTDFIFISSLIKKQLALSGFDYKQSLSDIENTLIKKINTTVYDWVQFYKEQLDKKYKKEFDFYFDRIDFASIPVSKNEIKKRTKSGLRCPFYIIDIDEFNLLYELSDRILYDFRKMINCFVDISNQNNLPIWRIVTKILKRNKLYLERKDNNIILKDNDKVLKNYPEDELKKLQNYILFEA